MEKISLLGEEYKLIIERKATRSLKLSLKEKNKLQVNAPSFTPLFLIKKFIKDHEKWIVEHNRKLTKKKDISKLKKLDILDETYEVRYRQALRESLVILDKKIFINYVNKGKIKSLVDRKMRPWALKIIREKVSEMARKENLDYGRISVKNQSSRFGSCSHGGNLNFNWQIILFPEDKFEHVLWHELAHLTVKNHSSSFWNLMAKYDPNFRQNRKWLKNEGPKRFIV
ncbi:DUF45 domain-containing protein [Candidatus Shapirobacteria bacterium]|jgi:predicted metal-dependent hydrolase|nr:DUF45 domain-containing protein [Candidatus Shapirobacteria bacterium]